MFSICPCCRGRLNIYALQTIFQLLKDWVKQRLFLKWMTLDKTEYCFILLFYVSDTWNYLLFNVWSTDQIFVLRKSLTYCLCYFPPASIALQTGHKHILERKNSQYLKLASCKCYIKCYIKCCIKSLSFHKLLQDIFLLSYEISCKG